MPTVDLGRPMCKAKRTDGKSTTPSDWHACVPNA